MLYYLSFIFIAFLLSLSKYNRTIEAIFLTILGFFVCSGYTTGSDWRVYEPMYNQIATGNNSLLVFMMNTEPGYVVYNYIFGSLGIDFWHFFILTKVILYAIVVRSVYKFCPRDYRYIALMFFIAWYMYFLFIDNPMRNLIAVCVFLLSLKSLINRNFWVFMGYTIIAVSFHTTALIMPILYWISSKRISTSNIVILYIILNIVLISDDLIYGILDRLFHWIPIVGNKIDVYSSGDIADGRGKIFSLGMIIHNIFFVMIILSRKYIENIKYGDIIFIFSILFLIFYRMGLTITVLGRLQFYLAIFYCTAIAVVINKFNHRSKFIYICYVLLVSTIPCVSYLTKTNKYIPYTNYFYMQHENMTFEERSMYNKIHSKYE